MNTSKTFLLGGTDSINRIGYGAMRLTNQPSNFGAYPNWQQGLELLQEASALGVNFFDSAYAYGPGWADKIIGEAFGNLDKKPFFATKGGVDKPAPGNIVTDGSEKMLLQQIDKALVNLKVEQIDLFQLHRVDPNTPIEISVAAIAKAQKAGKVKHIGLSNVSRDQLDAGLSVAAIASVQNRFNQNEQGDNDLVDYTLAKGIAYIPYGPLGAHPMKQGAALPSQQALKWLLERSPNIIVIPGTTSITHLRENVTTWETM
ncbi:aldo/keto reductase [Aliiglaciecola sp. M165]|uniref:aldo/keto reductase n=1 Tax=Aliiglaciecola sp. M165 TaxID=2593649 RepID=UPI00117D09FB|nr:aldo/keto reductase [Aliiglaciecola sp. M165]TRY31529.1 aldo/keto reductase [Aliiglaciecola sp. M165]